MGLWFLAVCALCIGFAAAQAPASSRLNFEALVYSRPYCLRRTGGWFNTAPFHIPAVTSGSTTRFYFNCVVRRPAWSECYGGCPSFYKDEWYRAGRFAHNCHCCRARSRSTVTPTWARCKYMLQIVNGCWLPRQDNVWVHKFQVDLTRYRYPLVGNCQCRRCGEPIPNFFGPTDIRAPSVGTSAAISPAGGPEISEDDIEDLSRLPVARERTSEREFQDIIRRTGVPRSFCLMQFQAQPQT